MPQHRTVLQAELREGRYPGRRIHNTPNFRIPLGTMFSYTLAAPILGMAQGALEEFESHTASRVNYTSGERMAESAPVHVRIAQAEAEIHAARLIMENDGREVFERARRDKDLSLPERARIRRNQAYVARLSVAAVDRLFEASGGHAIFDGSPLQRFHRDAHAASHHFSLSLGHRGRGVRPHHAGPGAQEPRAYLGAGGRGASAYTASVLFAFGDVNPSLPQGGFQFNHRIEPG